MTVEKANAKTQDLKQRLAKAESTLERIRDALGQDIAGTERAENDLISAIAGLKGRLTCGEERFRRGFQDSAVAQVIITPDRRFGDINPAFCKLFGYQRQDLLGQDIGLTVYPEDRQRFETAWQQLCSGKVNSYSSDRRHLHRAGYLMYVHVTVSAVRDSDGRLLEAVAHLQDVSNYVMTERALKASENRVNLAVQAARIGIWEWAQADDSLKWNSEMYRIYKVDPEKRDLRYRHWAERLHPDDRAETEQAVLSVRESAPGFHAKFRIIRPDGEVRWIEAHGQLQNPVEGQMRVLGMNMDITETVLNAERLRREEGFRRKITDTAPVAICVWNLQENHLAYANSLYQEICGYTLEEARQMGADFLDAIYPAGQREKLKRQHQMILADRDGETFSSETLVQHKSGKTFWAYNRETALTRDTEGKPTEVLVVSLDISERKQAEQLAREREEISRALVEESQELVSARPQALDDAIHRLLGRIGTISEADRSYIFLFESAAQKMSNTHEWCAEGIEPQIQILQDLDISVSPNLVDSMLRRENFIIPDVQALGDQYAAEKEILSVQGIQSAIMIPLIIGSEVLGFAGFDAVREKKVWEHEKVSLLRVMSDLVAATLQRRKIDEERARLMQELTTARDEAQAANRAKDDFLAVMSHELRTPLNPILGFSEILRESCPQDPEREYVDTIIESAQRQLKLVNSILNYSRLDKMSIKPRGERFFLLPAFRDALKDVQCIAHGLELEMLNGSREWQLTPPAEPGLSADLPDNAEPLDASLQVMLDRGMLRQLLDNLLSNACKYSEKGRVTLKVGLVPPFSSPNDATSPSPHAISSSTGVGTLWFAVQDTGIGISEGLAEQLFAPFTQADNSYTREYEGAGLGLAICRKLAEMLGGSITVRSKLGAGSCFAVQLPVKILATSAAAQPRNHPHKQDAAILESCKVLIVDDRADNASLLQVLVKNLGGQPEVCYNGGDCLEKVASNDYQLILLDLAMPGKDGFQTAAEIFAKSDGKSTPPIVAVSADVSVNARKRCRESGMHGFISKPVTQKKLREVLREVMPARQG